jgi:hypothetical protein
MKTIRLQNKVITTIATVLILAMVSCRENRDNGIMIQLPYDTMREGDFVLRRGRSMTSNLVIMRDKHSYSHIGMLQKSDSGWCVIHAVNDEYDFKGDFDRVKIEKIERFFSYERASAGAIVHSFVGDSIAEKISQKALQHVKDSTRFDNSFITDENSELYCTELIYVLYKEHGIDITEGRRTKAGLFGLPEKIIFPSDIVENKKLNIYFDF